MASVSADIFGNKPIVPQYHPLSLSAEQQASVRNNAAVLPSAEQLAAGTNLFTQEQITQMLNATMPGYSQTAGAAGSAILSETQGKLPTDVSAAVQESDAASALGGGFGGTGMGRNLVARDLGLTSLNLTNEGISSAESWMRDSAAIYEPSMVNVSSMFVSPQQQASFDQTQTDNSWNAQWLHNQVGAMPDPATAGIFSGIMGSMGSM